MEKRGELRSVIVEKHSTRLRRRRLQRDPATSVHCTHEQQHDYSGNVHVSLANANAVAIAIMLVVKGELICRLAIPRLASPGRDGEKGARTALEAVI